MHVRLGNVEDSLEWEDAVASVVMETRRKIDFPQPTVRRDR
jgi:hypothetical protein